MLGMILVTLCSITNIWKVLTLIPCRHATAAPEDYTVPQCTFLNSRETGSCI